MVEHNPDLVVRFDRELRHRYVNAAVERITGLSRFAYLGRTNEELGLPPELVAFWNTQLRATFEDTAPRSFRFPFTGVDGVPRHLEARVVAEPRADGPATSLLSVVRDVTELVAANETVRLQTAALEAAASAIVITDREGTILWCNPAFSRLTGYRTAEAIGRNPGSLVRSGRYERAFYAEMWATILGGDVWHGELVNRRKDGSQYHEEMSITPVPGSGGDITHFVAVKQDVTERRQREAVIARQAAALEQSPSAVVLADVDGRVAYTNLRFSELTGRSFDELIGRHLADLSAAEERPHVRDRVTALLTDGAAWHGELRGERTDGTTYWESVRLVALRDADGHVDQILRVSEDVTESRVLRQRLEYLGAYDPVTGLANRSLLLRATAAAIDGLVAGEAVVLAVVEVASLRAVNHAWGYAAGDRFLTALGERLQGVVRRGDVVARASGDRIAVVLPLRRSGDAIGVLTKLRTALERPFDVGDQAHYATVAIGVAEAPNDARDASTLLQRAETALAAALGGAGGQLRFFTDELSGLAQEALRIDTDLRHGLERGEFVLAYQPRVRLSDAGHVGFEGLVRWRHPDLGLLMPGAFIASAERTGTILHLGHAVARIACRQVRAWLDAGLDPGVVSINVSALELADEGYPERLGLTIADAGLAHGRIEVEVTETSAMAATDVTARALRTLRAMGVGVAIDDFGTGYSSLGYLAELPATTVKIDRSFVAALFDPSGAQRAIVKAIVDVAAVLGIDVVAEGIEDDAHLRELLALGCAYGQGYHFARPLDVEAATARLVPR